MIENLSKTFLSVGKSTGKKLSSNGLPIKENLSRIFDFMMAAHNSHIFYHKILSVETKK